MGGVRAATPNGLGSGIIYTIFPSIFSASGDLNGVTAQLGRLKKLGVTIVWLMPITPVGKAVNGHPSFDSPYCVKDYYSISPDYGTGQDLRRLVSTAHHLGIRVILDEVLNHSSWDNALVAQHPEYYVHSDNNPTNVNSIARAFIYDDVAQFNYGNPQLRLYMLQMLKYWVKTYNVDGFRFDSADNPPGPRRTIPADYWRTVGATLTAIRPDTIMLGECEAGDLENQPFQIIYGWDVYYRLKEAFAGSSAEDVVSNWHREATLATPSALLMSLQDDWDLLRDVNAFDGIDGAKAVSVFNFTNTGIPLIYNGMEIGNSDGGVNPHAKIDWTKGNPGYTKFFARLTALRSSSPALTQGRMDWLVNSAPTQLLTYERSTEQEKYIVEINISNRASDANLAMPTGPNWTVIGTDKDWNASANGNPAAINLAPRGFILYKQTTQH